MTGTAFIRTLALAMIGALFLGVFLVQEGAHASTPRSEVILDHPVVHGAIAKATGRPCLQEDFINCFWNAKEWGNGYGHSFYAVRVGHKVCTIYWNEKYNRRHGYCTHS